MIGRLAKMWLLHPMFIKPHMCCADSPATLNVTWPNAASDSLLATGVEQTPLSAWIPEASEKEHHWALAGPGSLSSEDLEESSTVYLRSVERYAAQRGLWNSFSFCLSQCWVRLSQHPCCVCPPDLSNKLREEHVDPGVTATVTPPTHRSSPSCQPSFKVHSQAINKDPPAHWSMGILSLI